MTQINETWQQLELLIANIQRNTAPANATVRHNHRVLGKAGRRRQLDVTVTARVGLHPIFIVIECKRYRRPVGIEKVEAFATKLIDVGASEGVIVSSTGFDEGARAMAREKGITLWSYREAQAADWQQILGPTSWLAFTNTKLENIDATLIFFEDVDLVDYQLNSHTSFVDANDSPLLTFHELIEDIYRKNGHEWPLTRIEQVITPQVEWFVRVGELRFQIHEIRISADLVARDYLVNVRMHRGHVLEDLNSNEMIFQELMSEGLNIEEIVNRQEGRILTQEEFIAARNQSNVSYDAPIDDRSVIHLIVRRNIV